MDFVFVFIVLTVYVSAKDTDLKVFRGKFDGKKQYLAMITSNKHYLVCISLFFYNFAMRYKKMCAAFWLIRLLSLKYILSID